MRHNNWLYFVVLPLAAIALVEVVTAGAAQARPAGAPAPLAAPAAPAITPTPHAGRFEDVPPSHPFAFFVECMGGRGIISGYQCGGLGEPCGAENKPYVRPGANVTRGQAAKPWSRSDCTICRMPSDHWVSGTSRKPRRR